MSAYTETVKEYFAEKARDYDAVDDQHYWRLSDQLLRELLSERILGRLPDDLRLLDAGGGTGRWTDFVLQSRAHANGLIFDLSAEMTDVAREKSEVNGYSDRLRIIVDNLSNVRDRIEPDFDLAFCFHNVLGFVDDPQACLNDLASRLRPGGALAVFAPNVYHGAYFNVSIGRFAEAERILDQRRGTFTSTMPDMHFFDAVGLSDAFDAAGLEEIQVVGTPSLIYPGYAESQLHGNTTGLADLLDDPSNFDTILDLERQALRRGIGADRGNNLLAIGFRPA